MGVGRVHKATQAVRLVYSGSHSTHISMISRFTQTLAPLHDVWRSLWRTWN